MARTSRISQSRQPRGVGRRRRAQLLDIVGDKPIAEVSSDDLLAY